MYVAVGSIFVCALLQAHDSVELSAILHADDPAQLTVWEGARASRLNCGFMLWTGNAVARLVASRAMAMCTGLRCIVQPGFRNFLKKQM